MKPFIALLLFIWTISCTGDQTDSKYLRWVGDIRHDAAQDDPAFSLCHGDQKVKQYFNFKQGLQYEGEKREILKAFQDQYIAVESEQSGWIRIRFIVNCKGETGRFRMMGVDEDYKTQNFDTRISGQLLQITKGLNKWVVLPDQQNSRDYYQYLIFKIEKGKLLEIMP